VQLSVQRSMSIGEERTEGGEGGSEGSSTRSMLGTYEYMSPEQKRGDEADARSDLYSVGLMAYRLLTGRTNVLKLPSRVDSALSSGWDDFVEQALEEDLDERLQSAKEGLKLLDRVGQDLDAVWQKTKQEQERREKEQVAKAQAAQQAAPVPQTAPVAQPRTEPARQAPAPAVPRALAPGQDIAVDLGGGVQMEFVWIPALKGWAGKYEVTNGEYRSFKPSHDSGSYEDHSLNHDRQPAVYVSWNDTQEFIRWMRANCELPQGYTLTLPSKDEWMTVAQCGDGRTYPWGNEWPPPSGRAGNYHGQEGAGWWGKISSYNDGFPVTAQVDKLWRNPWRLHGVGGNVWEWTEEKEGSSYGLLGASWTCDCDDRDGLRCNVMNGFDASSQNDHVGFRLFLRP
jgi:formylglycine-generating enzyme required for sulfatase activity